ncbi:MAG: hypothetical protein Q4C78_00320 [Synergistaceae bacterium]|nr:hypothetical protein [Synergistaceae bacterium]
MTSVDICIKLSKKIRQNWFAKCLIAFFSAVLRLSHVRYGTAKKNIELCFPDMTKRDVKATIAESYENMVRTGVELLSWQHDPSLIEKMVVEREGLDIADNVYAQGKGLIIASVHMSNWELAAAFVSRRYNLLSVVRHADSDFQREFIETLRVNSGLRTVSKSEPVLKLANHLRRGGGVALLSDQHEAKGIQLPFFGHLSGTITGPAALSYLTKAPIVPAHIIRIAPFKFKFFADNVIPIPDLPRNEAIEKMTFDINHAYEKMICRAKGQWLWQHRKFRNLK